MADGSPSSSLASTTTPSSDHDTTPLPAPPRSTCTTEPIWQRSPSTLNPRSRHASGGSATTSSAISAIGADRSRNDENPASRRGLVDLGCESDWCERRSAAAAVRLLAVVGLLATDARPRLAGALRHGGGG